MASPLVVRWCKMGAGEGLGSASPPAPPLPPGPVGALNRGRIINHLLGFLARCPPAKALAAGRFLSVLFGRPEPEAFEQDDFRLERH